MRIYNTLVILFFVITCYAQTGRGVLHTNISENANTIRFSSYNSQGVLLWYNTTSDSTVMIVGSNPELDAQYDEGNYSYITLDTLWIPDVVSNNGINYKVIQTNPYGVFNFVTSIVCIYLPASIEFIGDSVQYSEYDEDCSMCGIDYDCNWSFTDMPNLKSVHVDPANPYYTSIDGVVFSKDMKNLVLYPQASELDTFNLLDGCEHILRHAMYRCTNLKRLEFPNSLKSVGHFGVLGIQTNELVIKDSVEALGRSAFANRHIRLNRLVIGKQMNIIRGAGLPKGDTVVCHATVPPVGVTDGLSPVDSLSVLMVPRNSINAYQQASGWRLTQNIFPIEPPIVVGDRYAEVSWVQDFSATAYVWTLYLDENKMQPYMSLRFDSNGHLIDINLNPAPTRKQIAKGEEYETCYAAYYTFTISGLQEGTTFYYTRQSLSGDEVIDEESGSFQTLTSTSVDGVRSPLQPSHKYFENGQLIIYHNGKKYSITGEIVRE